MRYFAKYKRFRYGILFSIMSHKEKKVEKKKKFRITKESIWKVIILISSVLLILTSLAPFFLR